MVQVQGDVGQHLYLLYLPVYTSILRAFILELLFASYSFLTPIRASAAYHCAV